MKILVIKLSSLGDLFHALPAVNQVKQGLGAEIHWVTQKEYVELVRCFPDVSRVIPFFRSNFFSRLGEFLGELRRDSYDLVIDCQGLMKSALVAHLARAERRIAPSFCREGAQWWYREKAGKRNKNRHAVEENLDVVSYLGLPVGPPVFPLSFPRVEVEGSRPRVALLPASRWRTKNWAVPSFVQVARRLIRERGANLYLFGGRSDLSLCREIEASLDGPVHNLAGALSLPETGGWLQTMDLLISNDSGPVHMAAALGVPCVVVFGPTDPRRTGPFGERHQVVFSDVPCRPCFSRKCRYPSVRCMEGVMPDSVYAAASSVLDGMPS